MSEDNITPYSPDLKSVLTFRLAQLNNNLSAEAGAVLKAHSDLSLSEWRVISTIYMLDETTMTRLWKWAQVDKGQLSRTTKNLVAKDYVRATLCDSDGRQHNLCLTEQGETLYHYLVPIMRQRQTDIAKDVSEQDLAVFNRVLDQLSSNVKTMKDAKE